jgi:hypothetical protein
MKKKSATDLPIYKNPAQPAARRVKDLLSRMTLDIMPDSPAFYDRHMKYVVELGEFQIMVGNSSRDADLQKVILMVG